MTFARMIDSTFLQSVRLKDKGFSLEKHEQIFATPTQPFRPRIINYVTIKKWSEELPPTHKKGAEY